jgi:hypothetical protein|tara:strand:+ start:49 stop:519 length:471 start_codon:yes stop_codon:yes gene_type:complete
MRILFISIFFCTFIQAEEINLICKGSATVTEANSSYSSGQISGSDFIYGSENKTSYKDKRVQAEVIFHLNEDNNEGYIKLPSVMRPPIGAKNKDTFELKNISVSELEIKSEFRINFLNKPKVTISRVTGKMEYLASVWPKNFSGDCSVLDISKKKF